MSLFQANGVCPAILTGVVEILNPNDPGRLVTPVGGLQSLFDEDNTKGVTVQQLGAGDNGHRKTVRIAYKQRSTPSDVNDEKTCDTGEEKPRFEDTADVNLQAEHIIHVEEATVRVLCDAYSQLMSVPVKSRDSDNKAIESKLMIREIVEEILMDLDAMRQKLNSNFKSALALNIGNYVGGDASKNFTVIKEADHAVVYTGWNVLKQELRKIGMSGKPMLFGGGKIDLAMSALGIGCCNNAGQDIAAIKRDNFFNYYADFTDLESDLGDDDAFIMYYAKAIQFLQYNKYVGTYARPIGNMERGTMPDPYIPGLIYDIRFKPNECGEYYDLYINSDHDFYFAPDNMFKAGDRLEGVNGIFKGIAVAQS
jgi:hypothetical protein